MQVSGIVSGYRAVPEGKGKDGRVFPAHLEVSIACGDILVVGETAKVDDFGKPGSSVTVDFAQFKREVLSGRISHVTK